MASWEQNSYLQITQEKIPLNLKGVEAVRKQKLGCMLKKTIETNNEQGIGYI